MAVSLRSQDGKRITNSPNAAAKNSGAISEIAKSLTLSSSTVHNIIQRFRESGTISVCKGQGWKTILDAHDLRALRRHCITYRNATVMCYCNGNHNMGSGILPENIVGEHNPPCHSPLPAKTL